MEKKPTDKAAIKAAEKAENKASENASGKPKENAPNKTLEKLDRQIDEAIAKIRPKNDNAKWLVLAASALLLIGIFAGLLGTELSALQKFASCAIVLCLGGEWMRRLMQWDGQLGLIMFRDRSMLVWIDRQATRFAPVWRMIADIGIVFGYGLSSYFVMGKEGRKDKGRVAALLLTCIPGLLIFSLIIAPLAIGFIISMVQHTDIGTASAQIKESIPGQEVVGKVPIGGGMLTLTYASIAFISLLVVFGLAGVTTVSIIAYGGIILQKIGLALFGLADLSKTAPGGAPLLPGVNLPLVQGVIAMAVLLVVHELMHAFLSRIYKVRLDSAGIVFFGILPFGAFVDPDEKELNKLSDTPHNRILGAGSAANIVTAIISLFLLLGMFWATADMRKDGLVVTSGPLPVGSVISNIVWKGALGADVSTSEGNFYLPANSEGKLGIFMDATSRWNLFGQKYHSQFFWMEYVMQTLALVFSLNVLVGIVNMLPIPLFDGHHIAKKVLGEGLVLKALTWATAGAFVLNFIPWLFR